MSSKSTSSWLQSKHAEHFFDLEKAATDKLFRCLSGPNVLLMGDAINADKLVEFDFPQLVKVAHATELATENHDLAADCAFLPFQESSFSAVIVPHILESHELPHQVLREAHRVLQSDGHLLLTCMNPISWIGLQRVMRHKSVLKGEYYTVSRVKDWLHLLGFEVVASAMYHYAPLTRHPMLIRRFNFINSIGDRWFPMFGGSFVISARKRDFGLRLVGKTSLRKQRGRSLTPAPARRVESENIKTIDQP